MSEPHPRAESDRSFDVVVVGGGAAGLAEGSRVGAVINADLANEDAAFALAAMHGDGPEDWDRRYGDEAQLFSGQVNGSLVAEIEGVAPASVLDVGCGEGADAIWLARAGWEVTAVDISQVAIDRARRAADDAGVSIEWIQADIPTEASALDRYDLVSAHYPALRHAPGDGAIHALLEAVAPGGTLLVVSHDLDGRTHDHHPTFDPVDYVQAADVARHLDDGWTIEVNETRPRHRPPGHDRPDCPDIVLRARRLV